MMLPIETIARTIRINLENECRADDADLYFENGRFICPPFCEFVAPKVTKALKDAGYQCSTVVGTYKGAYHCWSLVDDVLIVDVTLDQFSERLPDVFIELESKALNYVR